MRHLRYTPHYMDYSRVPVSTIPGRSYSIAELLSRTVRGERLPGIYDAFEDSRHPAKDDDATVNASIDSFEMSPASDRSIDIADAWHIKDVIDEKMPKNV